MLRIDSHHHIWDQAVRPQDWMDDRTQQVIGGPFDLDDWQRDANGAGVSYGVFVQTVAMPDETPEVLALAAESTTLIGVVGWVDVDEPMTVSDTLDRLRQGSGGDRLVGTRVLAEYHPDPQWLATAPVVAAAHELGRRGLSLDLLTAHNMIGAAETLARMAPETRLVLDHLAKPTMRAEDFDAWARGIRNLAVHDNVACKVSGYMVFDDAPMTSDRLRPYVDVLLETFGPARLMFGSDWPVSLLNGGYAASVSLLDTLLASLSEHEAAQVWNGTVQRWYPSIATHVGNP